MPQPSEVIRDIQERLDKLSRDYRALIGKNHILETENKALAQSLSEALKEKEALKQNLDSKQQDSLREHKGLEDWKAETRKEIKSVLKVVEKCLPQVEELLEKK